MLGTNVHTAENQTEGNYTLNMHFDYNQSITDTRISLERLLYSPEYAQINWGSEKQL